jgi:lysophospholipase L1-like esterase
VLHSTRAYRQVLTALAAALALHACSGSQTQPTPPPPAVPDPPKITCPAPTPVQSTLGAPISVVYGTPTTVNGAQPVTIACVPPSGSTFAVGATPVTCTVTDARQRTDSCSFSVTVTVPPKIGATSYLAFGDSMTAGEVVSEGDGRARILRVDAAKSYPAELQRDLTSVYTLQAQSISVHNQGKPLESAVDGVSRLQGLIATGNYEALTLMEGAIDLGDRDSRTAQKALDAVRTMVRNTKGKGIRVFLATLPPENPSGCCPDRGLAASLVEPYNSGLRTIASQENVELVDVFQAFNGDITTLIDFDGLHPTPAGYTKIAETFFKSIKQALEQSPSSLTSPFRFVPFRAPARRR